MFIRDMIEEDKPQGQPAAHIQPQIAAVFLEENDGIFNGPRQMIGHNLNELHSSEFLLAEIILCDCLD